MTNTIPHDHHRLRPHHHQEMDQLQALAVKPQAKRQARRRTHTNRPYQERLLNMAEARREIVTALKIHRASISTRQQHQRSTYQQQQVLQQQRQEEEQQQVQAQAQAAAFQDRSQAAAAADEESSLAHTTMSYAAAAAASFANNPLCSSPPAAHWIAAGSNYCSPPPILRHPCDLRPPEVLPYTAAMGGLVELEHWQYQGGLERLVRSLPAQPLGLNLSFQGFGVSVDDSAKDCEDLFGSGSLPLTQPSPAYSYSYSPPAVETATTHAYGHGSPALSAADAEKHSVIDAPAAAALVPAPLDGGEMMAQQASTHGEMQQGVEWSEAAAADVAAWWSRIFESVESGQQLASRPNSEDVAAASGLPAEWWWLCGDDVVGVGEQGAITVTGNIPTPDVLGTMKHVDDGDGY